LPADHSHFRRFCSLETPCHGPSSVGGARRRSILAKRTQFQYTSTPRAARPGLTKRTQFRLPQSVFVPPKSMHYSHAPHTIVIAERSQFHRPGLSTAPSRQTNPIPAPATHRAARPCLTKRTQFRLPQPDFVPPKSTPYSHVPHPIVFPERTQYRHPTLSAASSCGTGQPNPISPWRAILPEASLHLTTLPLRPYHKASP